MGEKRGRGLCKDRLTSAGHGGSVVFGSEEAAVAGAGRGAFPDGVAVGRAFGTGSICRESLVVSDFASYMEEQEGRVLLARAMITNCWLTHSKSRQETFQRDLMMSS